MKRLAFFLIVTCFFLAGSSIAGNTNLNLPANILNTLQPNLMDSTKNLNCLSADFATKVTLNKTYMASNTSQAKLEDDLNENVPSKIKFEQIEVIPSSGSYQGGCMADEYYVKISGANFGNGWDINNVTICGIDVCHILMQSSNSVTVYPNPGTPGTGDIVITSMSKGKTTIKNGFTYLLQAPGN